MKTLMLAVAIVLTVVVAGFHFGVIGAEGVLAVALLAAAWVPGLFVLGAADVSQRQLSAYRASYGWH